MHQMDLVPQIQVAESTYDSCSQNYGPHLSIDYVTAPNIHGHQHSDPILGTTHLAKMLKR